MTTTPNRIICLGDSLTLSTGLSELEKWPTRLALSLEHWQSGAFAVYNRGLNGATTIVALDEIDSQVGYLLPGIVLVEFGINNANIRGYRTKSRTGIPEFESNLAEIHHYLTRKCSPMVLIAAHVPIPDQRSESTTNRYVQGNGKTYAENYLPYRAAILDMANTLKVPAIDIPSEIENRGLSSHDLVETDGLHLSPVGNAIYAEIVFSSIRRYWSDGLLRCGSL